MLKKLRTVVYHVSDLSAAKDWYQQITGIAPYFEQPFYVGFDINGCELGLDPDLTNIQVGNHSFVYWSVDDIQVSVEKITLAGGKLIDPIQSVGEGIQVAALEDPWGNAIGLIMEN